MSQSVGDTGTGSTTLARAARAGMRGDRERAGALADFLRARRARVSPEMVGLQRGRRRRTRGLRREEVAQLAGVSATWYTWLEQARAIRVSAGTVESLARALRLGAAERVHLFQLALGHAPPEDNAPPAEAPASLERLVASVGTTPAFVMGPRWELVAWNRSAAAVFGFDELAPGDRNMLWYMFVHPAARRRVIDWPHRAQRVLAQFRAATARLTGDAEVTALVERLREESAEFAEWWPRHDVLIPEGCRKEFDHPAAGRLVFEHHALTPSGAPGARLVLYVPLDDAETGLKVRELAGG